MSGVWNCLGMIFCFRFVSFFGFPVLSIFLAICSILELEGAISTVFAAFSEFKPLIFHGICNILVLLAAFWSWKLPCQRYLQQF